MYGCQTRIYGRRGNNVFAYFLIKINICNLEIRELWIRIGVVRIRPYSKNWTWIPPKKKYLDPTSKES